MELSERRVKRRGEGKRNAERGRGRRDEDLLLQKSNGKDKERVELDS